MKYYNLDYIISDLKKELKSIYNIEIPESNSQEWFNYYEILDTFKLIPNSRSISTLHICDDINISIDVIKYYTFSNLNKVLNLNCKKYNILKSNNKSSNKSSNKSDNSSDLIISNCIDFNKDIFVVIFENLNKNGSCILKFRYPIVCNVMIYIYLLYLQFKKISFYKPIYSNNTDFYIVCKKYTKIKKDILNKLKKDKIIYNKYSNHFKINIKDAINKITTEVINEIGKEIFYFRNTDDLPKQSIMNIKDIIKNKNKEWFKIFNIIKIDKKLLEFDKSIFSDIFSSDKSLKYLFSKHKLPIIKHNSNNNNNSNKIIQIIIIQIIIIQIIIIQIIIIQIIIIQIIIIQVII